MVDNTKVWLDSVTGPRNLKTFGMSSGLGATVADLPTDDVPAGSIAIDYTTKTLYFFDGLAWG